MTTVLKAFNAARGDLESVWQFSHGFTLRVEDPALGILGACRNMESHGYTNRRTHAGFLRVLRFPPSSKHAH